VRAVIPLVMWSVMSFWMKVRLDPSGCMVWIGPQSEGYGLFYSFGVEELAHRFAYRAERGPIPKGLLVCHTCDRPICVNPGHFFLGTDQDNNRDMIQKGRQRHPLGSRCGNAKLNEVQVLEIRQDYVGVYGQLRKLSKWHGVTEENLSNILKRKTWRHV
jgi:HNH endonuclease